ncbi:MAG TPA: FAD-binding oxidoreductase [Chloroflexia bacterium]|nr:FAD-binding oxidoreductase [Chloroflexia bacterium]
MERQSYSATAETVSAPIVDQLRAVLKGRVIAPGERDYDKARTVFYGGVDRHPLAVVRAAIASDVSQVVLAAREAGLPLAVRSGGHSFAAHGVCDDGIVLDLSEMKGIELDVESRTAWAEAGLTAGEFSRKAAAHGLAVGFGDTGSVGIGGITLGGGVGYLIRKYGLTIDALLAAEVVTADGQLLHVDAQSHPDLFWAIRGGGGNFGVVTRFRYRLQEVGTVIGGMLMLPATPEIIASFIAEAEAAPEELSTIANVMPALPMPFVPAEYHGRTIIMALMCYAGEGEAGERALAPFRALATPIVDMVRPIPYPQIYPPDDEGYHPVAAARSMFMDTVDAAIAETIMEHLRGSSGQMAVAQLRVLGGAMARVPDEATAFAHRKRRIMVNLATLYGNPDEAPVHEAWVGKFEAALRQSGTGVYVNFLGDEGAARVRDAYPGATWDRLAAIKARYDPMNLFRINHNIPPAN